MDNGVDAAALERLLRATENNPDLGLTQLDLGGNRFSGAGVGVLASYFETPFGCRAEGGIQALSVHDCRLGDAALAALLESLTRTKVQAVDVSRNNGGARAVGRCKLTLA